MHGQNGVSRKGPATGQASHYYSLTRLTTDGHIRLGLTPLRSPASAGWIMSSARPTWQKNIVGWDWFSLQLNDSTELMWYSLRHADGSPDPASGGTSSWLTVNLAH